MAFTQIKTTNELTPATAKTPLVISGQESLNQLSELINAGYMGHFYTITTDDFNMSVHLALQDYFEASTTHGATSKLSQDYDDCIEWKITAKEAPKLV